MNDINIIISEVSKQEKNILVDIYSMPNGRPIVGGKVPLHLQTVIEKMLVKKALRTFQLTSMGKVVVRQLVK